MKKGKNLLTIALCVAISSIPMQAAGYYRTKNVQYGGVNVCYNGVYQGVGSQAVVIDGTTYLPVKSFGNMLGLSTDWVAESQTVNVTGGVAGNSQLSYQAELQAKNYEIETLKKELATLKNEGVVSSTTSSSSSSNNYVSTSGTNITSSEVSETRRALNDQYSTYFYDIDFNFSLSLSSSRLVLGININDSSDYRKFNQLSRSEVKSFVEDVCDYIRERHDDIVISGSINYNNTSHKLYTFTYSKSDNLTWSYRDSYYDYYDDYYYIDDLRDIVDDTTSVMISGYSNRIYVRNTGVSTSSNWVTFTLYLDIPDDAKAAWNANTGVNGDSVLRNYLYDISRELQYETGAYIQCTLINSKTGSQIGSYNYSDNTINLSSI